MLFNTTLAQDRQFLINASTNTTNTDYWWANKNNFGRENVDFYFSSSFKTKDDKKELSEKLDDLVFYYNFNEKNLYKVWDLSGHCNFAAKNTYEDDLI